MVFSFRKAHSRRRFCAACCAAGLSVSPFGFAVNGARAQNSPPPAVPARYHTYYFKSQQPLTLDTTRFIVCDLSPKDGVTSVVRGSDGAFASGITPGLLATLSGFNIAGADVTPFYGQYAQAPIPQVVQAGGADAIETFFADLLAANPNLYIAPVLLDEKGGPVVVTRDVFVQFNEGTSEADIQTVLAGLDADTVTEQTQILPAPPRVDDGLPIMEETTGEEFVGGPMRLGEDVSVPPDPSLPSAPEAQPPSAGWSPSSVSGGGLMGTHHLQMRSHNGLAALAAMNALSEDNRVQFAEPNKIVRCETYSDPTVLSSFNPHDYDPTIQNTNDWVLWDANPNQNPASLNVPGGWGITRGDSSIIVAVLDTGISNTQWGVKDHTLPGYAVVNGQIWVGGVSPSISPSNTYGQHGTWVAGAISSWGRGGVGVAPDCKTISIRIITTDDSGNSMTDAQSFAVGIGLAERLGARITNCSTGVNPDPLISQAYERTRGRGMMHFAAPGNINYDALNFPANLRSVYAVGATTRNGVRWNDGNGNEQASNFGNGLSFVAPGKDVYLPYTRFKYRNEFWFTVAIDWMDNEWVSVNGTSFSSPYAAGVAALILSVNPALNADDVWQIMREKSRQIPVTYSGAVQHGRYNTEWGWGLPDVTACMREAARFHSAALTYGPDGRARMLWVGNSSFAGDANHPADVVGSRFALVTNDIGSTNYNFANALWFGPMPGWSPKALTVGGDQTPRLLMTKFNNEVWMFKVNPNAPGYIGYGKWYGSNPNWRAVKMVTDGNSNSWVMQVSGDGMSGKYHLWKLDSNFNFILATPDYQLPPGQVAQDLTITPDGRPMVLLVNADGTMYISKFSSDASTVFNLNSQYVWPGVRNIIWPGNPHEFDSPIGSPQEANSAAVAEWVPTALRCSPYGVLFVLFNGIDGRLMVESYVPYSTPDDYRLFHQETYGPVRLPDAIGGPVLAGGSYYYPRPALTLRDISIGTEGYANLLWNDNSGQAHIWTTFYGQPFTGHIFPNSPWNNFH